MCVCFVLSFIVYFLSVQCLSFFYGFCQMYFVRVCRIPKVDEELRVCQLLKRVCNGDRSNRYFKRINWFSKIKEENTFINSFMIL